MDFNIVTYSEYCQTIMRSILEGNTILFYSHIPTALVSLLLGGFIYFKNRKDLSSKLFFLVTIVFGLWSTFDLILWSSPDSRKTVFFWSIINFLENMVSFLTVYFAYVFLEKKDIAFKYKLISVFLFLPFLILLPTSYNISGFNATLCEAQQGTLINYFYFLEAVFFLTLVTYAVWKIRKTNGKERAQVFFLTFGSLFFLLSFSGANIAGSLASVIDPNNPDNWKILQYGLFGMPVFLSFLTYLIVRFQAFNMKLIGAQALVLGLISLIGSQIFFVRQLVNYILVGVTFVLAGGFGIVLIRSVKKEVEQREKLEKLAEELSVANMELKRLDASKSEFISIASHQLRTPLTAIRGFLELLLEGAYGKLDPKIATTLNKVSVANNRLMSLVENLLNISRIEAGRIQYQFAPTHIETILDELQDMFALAAKEKGIHFKVVKPAKAMPLLSLDAAKIREVISNIIDNSLKYTEKGSVTVTLEEHPECVAVVVKDTGMGIDPADLSHIFKKFERGTGAEKVNVSSTGLGLYVGQKFAEAHGGVISVASPGKGQGATFTLELPIHVVEQVKRLPTV